MTNGDDLRRAAGRRARLTLAGCLSAALALPALAVPGLSAAQDHRADPEAPSGFDPKPTVFADDWMIVAANPLAAEAGAAVLRDGGSALDAGIAAQMALNVVEPQSSGVGGGAFALYWRASTGKLTAWDGRETAPLNATPDYFYLPDPDPTVEPGQDGAPALRKMSWPEAVASGRSIGAPGVVRLLEAMHERFGVKDWEDLFQPAIRLAAEGFPISPRLHASIASAAERLAARPETAQLFLTQAGAARPVGETMVNPALAESLEDIADDGSDAFYEDDIAEAIVAAVAAEPVPGALTLEDLEKYRAVERQPVCMIYREIFEVCGMGAPSSGAVGVGQILGLLSHFPIEDLGVHNPATAHLFLEASRLAFADRAQYLADPDYVSVPQAGLLDPTYLLLRAQAIRPSRAYFGKARAGNPPWKEATLYAPDLHPTMPGTTHISVVDSQGDVFVMTSSIETAFGSGRMAGGFLLNNQLTDFSFEPSRDGLPIANAVGPRKRPRSSMAPTIVFDISNGQRRPILALGSPGGSRIIEYVAGAILNAIEHKMLMGDVAALPHVSHRNRTEVQVERRQDADALAEALGRFGHLVQRVDMTSGLHIISIGVDGSLSGGADPRREGVAIGE